MYARGAPDTTSSLDGSGSGPSTRLSRISAKLFPWARYHHHLNDHWNQNAIFVAAEGLMWSRCRSRSGQIKNEGMLVRCSPGGGVFRQYAPGLRLTAPGRSRSIWSLPAWFEPVVGRPPLAYHGNMERWALGGDRVHLTTVGRGQEFFLDLEAYLEALPWLGDLLEG